MLKLAGTDPAPERRKRITWREFPRAHWEVLAAADFFTVEVWTVLGLFRYQVLSVMRLATRQVHTARIIYEPHEQRMKQAARNLTEGLEGFLQGCRYLLHGRSGFFSEGFRTILESAGLEPVRLPARSPNLNAFAERFVRTIKESSLDQLVLFAKGSLRRATSSFLLHYHQERNDQVLEKRIPRSEFLPLPTQGAIRCRKRLGGLLRYHYR